MSNHLKQAHILWKQTLSPEDVVIDATCGNGHDTLFLAELGGQVIAYDIQSDAIEKTRAKVPQATFHHQSHASFVETQAALIIYNLGYLPGGDKQLTTRSETTLQSVGQALQIATKAISITCYPGHPEGAREEALLVEFVRGIDPKQWMVCHHQWLNRKAAPSLLWLLRLPL